MKESTLSVNLSNERLQSKQIHLQKRSTTIVLEVIAALFIILFNYAAISKWIDLPKFELQLAKSPMLTRYSGIIPWTMPTLEIIITLLLAIPKFRLIGLYAAYSLMVIFTSYIVAITQFSEYIPCSCGGILQNMSWNQHLVFNLVFLLFATLAIFIYPRNNGAGFE